MDNKVITFSVKDGWRERIFKGGANCCTLDGVFHGDPKDTRPEEERQFSSTDGEVDILKHSLTGEIILMAETKEYIKKYLNGLLEK